MGLKSLPLPGGQPTANVKTTNVKIPFTVKNKTSRRRISTLTGRSGIGFLQSPSPVPLLMPREPDLFFCGGITVFNPIAQCERDKMTIIISGRS
jgi:hypothetical protein